MFGKIIQGILDECQELFKDTGATVLLNTHFSPENFPLYKLPVLILDISESPEIDQYIGGVTRMDWNFSFKVYMYEPNPGVDIDNEYSTSLLNHIDDIRRHFTGKEILSDNYQYIIDNYNFILTLNGIDPAPAITKDGLTIGFTISFQSTSIDTETSNLIDSTQVLEHAYQIPDDASMEISLDALEFKKKGDSKDLVLITNTSWYFTWLDNDWFNIDYISGFKDQVVTLTCFANDTGDERMLTVTLHCPLTDIEDKEITITQLG